MTTFKINLEGDFVVSKGPRDKSWVANATIDLAKLPEDIVRNLALHGLKQKIADAAASAKMEADATAAMEQVIIGLLAGEWSTRGVSDGADAWTIVARSIMRSQIKASVGAKSEAWAAFTGLPDAEQIAKLDANIEDNRETITPAVDAELERRIAARKAKTSLGGKIAITI